MDMMLVLGIDSSAVKSFEKLARYLEKKDIDLVIVNTSEHVRIAFEADGLNSSDF